MRRPFEPGGCQHRHRIVRLPASGLPARPSSCSAKKISPFACVRLEITAKPAAAVYLIDAATYLPVDVMRGFGGAGDGSRSLSDDYRRPATSCSPTPSSSASAPGIGA